MKSRETAVNVLKLSIFSHHVLVNVPHLDSYLMKLLLQPVADSSKPGPDYLVAAIVWMI